MRTLSALLFCVVCVAAMPVQAQEEKPFYERQSFDTNTKKKIVPILRAQFEQAREHYTGTIQTADQFIFAFFLINGLPVNEEMETEVGRTYLLPNVATIAETQMRQMQVSQVMKEELPPLPKPRPKEVPKKEIKTTTYVIPRDLWK